MGLATLQAERTDFVPLLDPLYTPSSLRSLTRYLSVERVSAMAMMRLVDSALEPTLYIFYLSLRVVKGSFDDDI